MSKYVKALEELCNGCEHKPIIGECKFKCPAKEELKELVDRATPIKPQMMRVKEYDGYNLGICKCGKCISDALEEDTQFCPCCGQAITWEDDKDEYDEYL